MDSNEDSIETFLISDKVVAIVNLLTKFRIKLWELKDLSLNESQNEVEVSQLKSLFKVQNRF